MNPYVFPPRKIMQAAPVPILIVPKPELSGG